MFRISTICLATVIAMILLTTASAYPQKKSKHTPYTVCKRFGPERQEVCQYCAKMTKSSIVYPMCMQGDENACEWCVEYLNFGRHRA